MKKRIGIEVLLKWAYRDELQKLWFKDGPGEKLAAWDAVERFGELLSDIDAGRNRYGVVMDFSDWRICEPDAIAVADAVLALDDYLIEIPDDWFPLDDLPDLGAHGAAAVMRALNAVTVTGRDGMRVHKRRISQLVMFHAIMGAPSAWEIEAPKVEPVKANGKARWFRKQWLPLAADGDKTFGGYEIEVDGYNARAKRPYVDAYQKFHLVPDPNEGIIGRAEYELWRSALDVLVDNLGESLQKWAVEPCTLPYRPWVEGLQERRILPVLCSTSARD